MRHRRNARPNENQIPTVRIRKAIRSLQGLLSNPRRRKARKVRRSVKRRAKKSHKRVARRVVRPPKGKRVGAHFKRNKRWFRVSRIKVRVGRRKVSRRVARKSSFRAAQRAKK